MSNRYLLMWLEGPIQSWGYDSRFNRRDTLDFPTKSGVLGIILCAMGASGEQRELLQQLSPLKHTAYKLEWFRKDKKPINTLLHDFQMVGSGYDNKDNWQSLLIPKTKEGKPAVGGGTKLTHRYYLQDLIFTVIVEVPEHLADNIANAMQNPIYPLYLGRRSCVPTDFIYRGMFISYAEAENYLRKLVEDKSVARNDGKQDIWSLKNTGIMIEGHDIPNDLKNKIIDIDTFTLNDVPICFGQQKRYSDREVTKIKLIATNG